MATIKGGDKLEAALKALAAKVGKKATLQVGFLENATYPDGEPVAMVAAIQEFGAPAAGVPPRPFLRPTVQGKSPEWPAAVAATLKANDYDASKTLAQVGDGIKGQIQQAIVDVSGPALSPLTLMLRQMKADDPDLVVTGAVVGEAAARVAAGKVAEGVSTKPLVESGHMLQSVDYVVTS